MKNKDILRAINDIDWDMVEDARATDGIKADGVKPTDKRKKIPKGFWTKGALAAACLCLAVITVFTVLPRLNSITPPIGGDETPGESTDAGSINGEKDPPVYNTIEVPEDLIEVCITNIPIVNLDIDYSDWSDEIDKMKSEAQPIYVAVNPNDYYFVCGYYKTSDPFESYNHSNTAEYIWIGFDSADKIPQYYNESELMCAIQINKPQICRDNISGVDLDIEVEHCQIYKPQFVEGYNVAPAVKCDDKYVYLNYQGNIFASGNIAYHALFSPFSDLYVA